jgi:putative ABC transport system substrate-binding protein
VLLLGSVGYIARPIAQDTRRLPTVGVLMLARDPTIVGPFVRALEARGYVDGRTVALLYGFADGKPELLSDAAVKLVDRRPDVIFSYSGEAAPLVKRATATIPIVVAVSNDPVRSGLVHSLARPGGNITGVTFVYDELAGKLLELLKEAVPKVSRVAILWNPDHADPEFNATQRAAQLLNVSLQSLPVHDVGDFDGAFQSLLEAKSEAIIVVWSRVVSLHRERIAEFARANRLLLVSNVKFWIELGGLLTYGPDVGDLVGRCAEYVDKVLKGARPSDLPMQQPTSFRLAINNRVARQYGITLPSTLLARVDDLIE